MTAGAVLCGGASRRMGTDKALVEVDGVAMAERVAGALAAGGCDPVAFVGGDLVLLRGFRRLAIADRWPGGGPVGAIVTALDVLADDVVVAACDLPFLDGTTIGVLRAAAAAAPDAAVVVAETDRLQPLVALWRIASRDAIARAWDDGTASVREVIDALSSATVPVDASVVRNVNRPEDLP